MSKDSKNENNQPKSETTKVGVDPKRNILILVIIGIVFMLILYNLYNVIFPAKTTGINDIVEAPDVVSKPSAPSSDNNMALPKLPSAPTITAPVIKMQVEPPIPIAPPPPPPPTLDKSNNKAPLLPGSVQEAVVNAATSGTKKAGSDEDARRKSSIMYSGGGAGGAKQENKDVKASVVKEGAVTYKGDDKYLLVKGKIINAITETAMDSDVGGELRAIISNDVYSQSGKVVLIPKGSRVFGSYSSGTGSPLGRLQIQWNRVDMPNGYTVDLTGSFGIDNLAKKGVYGKVDRKILEQLASSVLSSIVNIGVAKGLDTISPPKSTTVSSANAAAISTLQSSFTALTGSGSTQVVQATNMCNSGNNILTSVNLINPNVYQNLINYCNSNGAGPGLTPTDAQAALIISTFNNQISSLTNTSSVTTTTSATQQAADAAYQDFGNTLKNITKSDDFTTNVTIPQGTSMNIYVNQDFLFPSNAVQRINRQ